MDRSHTMHYWHFSTSDFPICVIQFRIKYTCRRWWCWCPEKRGYSRWAYTLHTRTLRYIHARIMHACMHAYVHFIYVARMQRRTSKRARERDSTETRYEQSSLISSKYMMMLWPAMLLFLFSLTILIQPYNMIHRHIPMGSCMCDIWIYGIEKYRTHRART